MNIASYQILSQIKPGGQAMVYRARHTILQREVALKVLHVHLITEPDFVTKFAQEAQLLAQLQHPNIVQVFNAGYDPATGAYFIEMELLTGNDLDALIAQQGRLAVDAVLSIAKQVAATLEYAHARNLVHRDIKPGNIMLLPNGAIKVLDFGIAAIVAAGQKAKTRIGTVEYMAPEHFAGSADARSDIYSLGATMYHCLTGQTPPVVASQPPTPVRQLNPAVSPALENVILKALQSDASKRQKTAREFIIEIENAERAPGMVKCPHCNAANRPNAKHCAKCGQAIASTSGKNVRRGKQTNATKKIKRTTTTNRTKHDVNEADNVKPIVEKNYSGLLKVRMGDPLTRGFGYQPEYFWSPDGKRLLVLEQSLRDSDLNHFSNTRTVSSDAIWGLGMYDEIRIERRLDRTTESGSAEIVCNVRSDSCPTWSPDCTEIAYSSAENGKIWAYNLITGKIRQLTNGNGIHTNPLWSLDYRYVTFSNVEQGTPLPFGDRKVQIISNSKIKSMPDGLSAGWNTPPVRFGCLGWDALAIFDDWHVSTIKIRGQEWACQDWRNPKVGWISPNHIAIANSWLTFIPPVPRDEFGGGEIYLLDVNNQSCHRWWLPGSSFVCSRKYSFRVASSSRDGIFWIENPQGQYHSLLGIGTAQNYRVCDWSPDANKILFTRTVPIIQHATPSLSDRVRQAIGLKNSAVQTIFSPSYGSEIYVVNIDDTGLQKLTDGYDPKWSPDGKYIAFLRSPQEQVYELWVMQVE